LLHLARGLLCALQRRALRSLLNFKFRHQFVDDLGLADGLNTLLSVLALDEVRNQHRNLLVLLVGNLNLLRLLRLVLTHGGIRLHNLLGLCVSLLLIGEEIILLVLGLLALQLSVHT